MSDERFVLVRYDEIARDARFDGIREDDRRMGLWLRLLMLADPLWPALAPLPFGLSRAALDALVKAGLVEVSGHYYHMHGLDREKARRSEHGRKAAEARWLKAHPPTAGAMPEQCPSTARAMPDQCNREVEVEVDKEVEVEGDADGPIAFMETTLSGCSRGSVVWDWCTRLAREYGTERFRSALASECAIDPKLPLKRTETRLQREAAKAMASEKKAEERKVKAEHAPVKPLREIPPEPMSEEQVAAAVAAYKARKHE